jgi:hypothetical protein
MRIVVVALAIAIAIACSTAALADVGLVAVSPATARPGNLVTARFGGYDPPGHACPFFSFRPNVLA